MNAKQIVLRLCESESFLDLIGAETRKKTWKVHDLEDDRVFYVPDTGNPADLNKHLVDGHRYRFTKVDKPG